CRDAPDHGCGRSFACGTSYAWVVTCAYPLLSSFFLGRDGFDFLRLATDDLTLENPNLHTDHTVGGVGFSRCVVDIGTQGVQRHTAFTVPFGTGDLGAAETAADLDLDTLATDTHGVLNRALHRTTEHHTTLQLLSNALRHQTSIELRLADFFDVDMYRHAHLLGQVLTQLFDVLALLANHDAGTGSVTGDASGLGRTLNINAADRGGFQFVLDVLTYLQVCVQIVRVSATICIPHRSVLFNDTEANTRRIYFLTHDRLLLVSNLDRDVARPLDDAISTALGTWHDALQGATFVNKHGGDLQVIHVCAIVMLGVGNRRLEHFLDDISGLLVAES